MDEKIVYGISVVVENEEGKNLFVKENVKKIWKNKGQFSVVMGTCDEVNGILEKPEKTAIRELKEEINISIKEEKLKYKGEYVMYVEDLKIFIKKYFVRLNNEEIKKIKINNPEEIQKISWLNKDDLKKIDLKKIRPGTIESLLNSNLDYLVFIKNGLYNKKFFSSLKKDLDNL